MKAPAFWRTGGAASVALAPLGWLYGAATRARLAVGRPYRAPVPVFGVGNLTAGGTGKTPTVVAILSRLAERGIEAHAVTRGHGGTEKGPLRVDPVAHRADAVGDEPLLLSAHAPTWVARDRAAGVRAAVEAGARAVVLDDGHQNPSVAKDLSIVVVDAEAGFGNGRMIPAGPLREPVRTGLARADAVLLIGEGEVALPGYDGLVLRGRLRPRFSGISLSGARVFAFCGIGRPEKFFDTVRAAGAVVVDSESFPDHHRYAPRMVERLLARADGQGLMAVTTEKDMVKLPPSVIGSVWPVPVGMVPEDETAFAALLEGAVA